MPIIHLSSHGEHVVSNMPIEIQNEDKAKGEQEAPSDESSLLKD
jgi:hypothetical protein